MLLAMLLLPSAVDAHEVRPAYLQVTEVSAGRFAVLWKQPILPDADPGLVHRLPLEPRFPSHCREGERALPDLTATALLERWTLTCGEAGLLGAEIAVDGLPRTLTDVLLRVRLLDGTSVDHLLRSEAPRVLLSREATAGTAVPTYLLLGIEHLLFGFDHILFVVGLLFFVQRPLQLVQVVTAFTGAHSITLALSSLGVVTLSQRPVEAVIALSILFLAVELARGAKERAVGDGALALGDRFRIRPAARIRLRRSSGGDRTARVRPRDGPAAVQRRGRDRPARRRRRSAGAAANR